MFLSIAAKLSENVELSVFLILSLSTTITQ